jgi:cytochrome c biogenesis protein CcmG, thiol:disulfide interchange protein DsbE
VGGDEGVVLASKWAAMRARGRGRLLIWAVVLAAAAALLAVGLAGKGTGAGRRAPALPREGLGGAPVTLPSLLASGGGHPALVLFWASWCTPCKLEAPAVERFAQSAAGRGRLVGVDWADPSRSEAQAFIGYYRWSFPDMRDEGGTVGEAYGLTVLPTTFVVDAQGRIRQALRGPQTVQSLTRALAAAGD